jgi:hypothetical protein
MIHNCKCGGRVIRDGVTRVTNRAGLNVWVSSFVLVKGTPAAVFKCNKCSKIYSQRLRQKANK